MAEQEVPYSEQEENAELDSLGLEPIPEIPEELVQANQLKQLKKYRGNLVKLIFLSSGLDAGIFAFELPLLPLSFGSSLIIDEIIEYFASKIFAGKTIDLKRRYKLVGFAPVPGITSLSVQCGLELVRTYRKKELVMEELAAVGREG